MKIGETYRLYGRISSMRRMKPVSKDRFVTNLLYADLYTPQTRADLGMMLYELELLNAQGMFEYRQVSEDRR